MFCNAAVCTSCYVPTKGQCAVIYTIKLNSDFGRYTYQCVTFQRAGHQSAHNNKYGPFALNVCIPML